MPLEIDPVTAKMSWEIMKLRMREQVRVRDVMRRNIMSIDSNMPVEEAAELMIRSNAQCIAVKEDGEISGMINERDLVKAIRDPRKSVGNISSPPLTVNIDTSLLDVVRIMGRYGTKSLLITEEDDIAGYTTLHDLLVVSPELIREYISFKDLLDLTMESDADIGIFLEEKLKEACMDYLTEKEGDERINREFLENLKKTLIEAEP